MEDEHRFALLLSAIEFIQNIEERKYRYIGELHISDLDAMILCVEIENKGSFNVCIQAIDYPRDTPRYSYRVKSDTAVNARLDENVKLKTEINYDMFDLKNHIMKIQP